MKDEWNVAWENATAVKLTDQKPSGIPAKTPVISYADILRYELKEAI